MRRRFSRGIIATLLAASFVLLMRKPRHAAPHAEGVTRVQYWEKFTGHEGEQMKEIVDAFNATVGREKGIFVDYVSMSQVDRKILVATAGGVPPDVAGTWDSHLRQFASMGALEPLDDYVNATGIRRDDYYPVYYDGCTYEDRLYALPSTPWNVALVWNKELFAAKASALRAAGLDPDRPPATLAELDRYAAILDEWETSSSGRRRLKVAGYLPMEPGWFVSLTAYWWGGDIVDGTGTKLLFTSPQMIAGFDWIRSYSERLGRDAMTEFRGGVGSFDSPQNSFISGLCAMSMQGPWMANLIEKHRPSMNRWGVPQAELDRERAFGEVREGTTLADVDRLLGPPASISQSGDIERRAWPAGIKTIHVNTRAGRVVEAQAQLLPAVERQKYCQWGTAPFPSAVPGLDDVTYAASDVLVIPKGAKRKREAFEFIAFVNRQDQMERLCSLHCKSSPLRSVTPGFLREHPNPYVQVFQSLSGSPNARPLPHLPNWPEVTDELKQAADRVNLLQDTTERILRESEARAQAKLDRARKRIGLRARRAGHAGVAATMN